MTNFSVLVTLMTLNPMTKSNFCVIKLGFDQVIIFAKKNIFGMICSEIAQVDNNIVTSMYSMG